MEKIINKLNNIKQKIETGKKLRIALFGFGSVANYLFDYLMSWEYQQIEIHICTRNIVKVNSDINIIKVANAIRYNSAKDIIIHEIDLDKISSIEILLREINPDFIVNTSRAYSGIKYGSISWNTIRAYGIWMPLSVKFIHNIMIAYERSESKGIVINTSYSDGTNPWLKSAGISYPDFGSGNLNHLIPRIKYGVSSLFNVKNFDEILVILATSHFHDVVISKEGQTEGIDPLLKIYVSGNPIKFNSAELYRRCALEMPTNEKRNMMNASSNFEIISKVVRSATQGTKELLHSPGFAGNIGGYPVYVNYSDPNVISYVESAFNFNQMLDHNKKSLALDGIEKIENGFMFYTEKLIKDTKISFGINIPRAVHIEDANIVANLLIEKIIKPKQNS